MDFRWTDTAVETLKRNWMDGHTATDIAKLMGGVSRSAVLGKVHRLKLDRGKSNIQFRTKPGPKSRPEVAKPRRRNRALKPTALQAALAALPAMATEAPIAPDANDIARVSSNDLEPHHCRWPCGEVTNLDAPVYCGEPKLGIYPYCPEHARRAYAATSGPEPRPYERIPLRRSARPPQTYDASR